MLAARRNEIQRTGAQASAAGNDARRTNGFNPASSGSLTTRRIAIAHRPSMALRLERRRRPAFFDLAGTGPAPMDHSKERGAECIARSRMLWTAASLALAAIAAVCQPGRASADNVENFYSGRTFSILVGNSPGGGYDAQARLLSRHIGDHIPGRPTVVVQNMPGAGGLSAANYFANVGPRDGSQIALIARTALLARMIAPNLVHFDVAKFNWLGTMMSEPGVLISWHTAPDQTAQDLFMRTLIVGGAGKMDDSETTPKVLNAVIGTKLKVIGGYPGMSELTMAMERGEVEGVTDWSWSNAKQLKPQYLKNHLAAVLMQLDVTRASDLPDTPTPTDFAKSDADKTLLKVYFTTKRVSRPVALPPGAPPDRVAALRTAFIETMRDPAFLADAKSSHIPVDPSSYQSVLSAMDVINSAPPETVRRLTEIFSNP